MSSDGSTNIYKIIGVNENERTFKCKGISIKNNSKVSFDIVENFSVALSVFKGKYPEQFL